MITIKITITALLLFFCSAIFVFTPFKRNYNFTALYFNISQSIVKSKWVMI